MLNFIRLPRLAISSRDARWRLLGLILLLAAGCEQASSQPKQEYVLSQATHPIAFTPDGKRLLTRSRTDGGMVKAWDPRTGQELADFSGPDVTYPLRDKLGGLATKRLSIGRFVLSPQGTLAASVEVDHQVPPPPGPISPKDVAVRLREGCVLLLWDTVTGEEVRSVPVGLTESGAVAFSPDGKFVALTDALQRVRLIEVETGKVLSIPPFPPRAADCPISQLAFSPDGKRLACARSISQGSDGVLSVWDIASGECVWKWGDASVGDWTLAFSPDGSLLAVAGCSGSAGGTRALRLANGERDTRAPAGTARRAPKEQRGKIYVRDARDGKHGYVLTGHQGNVHKIAFHSNGRYLASAGDDSTARIWDLQTKKAIHSLPHARSVTDIALSPDGNWLATACEGGTPKGGVIVWNMQPAKGTK